MKVLVLNHDAEEYKEILTAKFPSLTVYAAATEEEAVPFIEEADILTTIRISDDLMKKARSLKWIQAMTTGTDYITKLPSLRKEVLLTSTRGIHGPQMSEMAVLLMIALSRDFPKIIQNQSQKKWERWPAKLLWKKKVAIMGVGIIGEAIAQKCKVFDMKVIGLGHVAREVPNVDHFYTLDKLHDVMAEVDYFICVAPGTPEYEKMLGKEAFERMKPTAYFINIGRGEVVDEEALIRVLMEKKIAGAALDTFWEEPLPPDSPLWELENTIITPHVGGMSDIYVEQVMAIFEENLRRFLRGERDTLLNLVQH
ncbi:MAG: D-2-hydroxyacid dehydrogenase [Deltaproteobacteria bacterium]|nr:D-2-hydroxyacid dehydrogenase [Deltaproteobacteria bacterium]MBW2138313.1 D-2-hydroxyacid dehydrogenase [Deltaproteobacteria bacterium]